MVDERMDATTEKLLRVGDVQYYVHDTAKQHIIPPQCLATYLLGRRELIPCTIVNRPTDRFDDKELDIILNDFAHDDVWNPSFLDVIILRKPKSVSIRVDEFKVNFALTETFEYILDGPYAIRSENGDIFGVSRLFDDRYNAFIGGSVQRVAEHRFGWLNIENRIAIPSKLYYEVSPARPLLGLRFAVKDIVDIAGLETGCGNRSYRSLYPKRTALAPCVQRLLDAGAIFVGKTKTTQFAEGELPTQWLDYLAPFNPRGDSYQSPSSSSAGSAVASAAYTWLDFTIATDTGGSTRHPAGVCGIYGLRTSIKAINATGMYSVSSLLDSVGILARSAFVIERIMKCIAEPSFSFSSLAPQTTYKLLYPVRARNVKPEESRPWFPYPGEASEATDTEACFETIVQQFESYFGCKRTCINLDELWYKTRPVGVGGSESLNSATEGIYKILSTYTSVREGIDPFIAEYKAANHGRIPFIDPIVQARHTEGRRITSSQYTAAVKSAESLSKWIVNVLLASSEENEFPLLVFPQNWGNPSYRDEQDRGSLFDSSFSIYSLSYLSGSPDCTVPVGEVSRHSRIIDSEMLLSISLSILSRPGTDLALLALLAKLENVGILNAVGTGSTMYSKSL